MAVSMQVRRQQRKLNFLITQTELYAHFMAKKLTGMCMSVYIYAMYTFVGGFQGFGGCALIRVLNLLVVCRGGG